MWEGFLGVGMGVDCRYGANFSGAQTGRAGGGRHLIYVGVLSSALLYICVIIAPLIADSIVGSSLKQAKSDIDMYALL